MCGAVEARVARDLRLSCWAASRVECCQFLCISISIARLVYALGCLPLFALQMTKSRQTLHKTQSIAWSCCRGGLQRSMVEKCCRVALQRGVAERLRRGASQRRVAGYCTKVLLCSAAEQHHTELLQSSTAEGCFGEVAYRSIAG